MDEKTCINCRWWDNCPSLAENTANERKMGYCKRRSPQVMPNGGKRWPETLESDWCGEFKEKGDWK